MSQLSNIETHIEMLLDQEEQERIGADKGDNRELQLRVLRILAAYNNLEAENARLRELLEMAASQLRYIGCFAGCDNGVMRDNNGNISQCQCCDEQKQIEQALKK